VNGFSGALYKKFKTRKEAQHFVDRHRAKPAKDSEDEDNEHSSHTSTDSDLEDEPFLSEGEDPHLPGG